MKKDELIEAYNNGIFVPFEDVAALPGDVVSDVAHTLGYNSSEDVDLSRIFLNEKFKALLPQKYDEEEDIDEPKTVDIDMSPTEDEISELLPVHPKKGSEADLPEIREEGMTDSEIGEMYKNRSTDLFVEHFKSKFLLALSALERAFRKHGNLLQNEMFSDVLENVENDDVSLFKMILDMLDFHDNINIFRRFYVDPINPMNNAAVFIFTEKIIAGKVIEEMSDLYALPSAMMYNRYYGEHSFVGGNFILIPIPYSQQTGRGMIDVKTGYGEKDTKKLRVYLLFYVPSLITPNITDISETVSRYSRYLEHFATFLPGKMQRIISDNTMLRRDLATTEELRQANLEYFAVSMATNKFREQGLKDVMEDSLGIPYVGVKKPGRWERLNPNVKFMMIVAILSLLSAIIAVVSGVI